LPLQAHPDRKLAEQLMKKGGREKRRNETLTNPSRKHEMAITTSNLSKGSIGFRSILDIRSFI
ncbi:hypothetical protein HOY80DRAFT_856663, partial [Tuber brumale]